jgi:tetratricopeptide (TPR) repeat protein
MKGWMLAGLLVAATACAGNEAAFVNLSEASHALELARGTLDEGMLSRVAQAYAACEGRAQGFLCTYQQARAEFCMALALDFHGSRRQAKLALDQAEAGMRAAIAINPKSGDAEALLGMILGQQIGWGGMFSGMRIGPKIGEANDRAKALSPDSPVVELGLGIQYLLMPSIVGGSAAKAEAHLRRSVQLDPGVDDTWLWLAKSERALGNRAEFDKDLAEVFKINAANVLAQKERDSWAKR